MGVFDGDRKSSPSLRLSKKIPSKHLLATYTVHLSKQSDQVLYLCLDGPSREFLPMQTAGGPKKRSSPLGLPTPRRGCTARKLGEPRFSSSAFLPFLFLGKGSATKIDYRKSWYQLILSSLLEDLGAEGMLSVLWRPWPGCTWRSDAPQKRGNRLRGPASSHTASFPVSQIWAKLWKGFPIHCISGHIYFFHDKTTRRQGGRC